jgi:hypothetical protein
MSFARYAALVKNLRGVVLANLDGVGVWDSIRWMVKRFRYRDLGLTPSMIKKYRDRLAQYLNGNPFVELTPPINAVEHLVEVLSNVVEVGVEVLELLIYASTYISPAIVIGFDYLEDVKKLAVDTVNICRDLDLNSWKLHLRIADYTILDFYRECVDEVLSILRSSKPEERVKMLKNVIDDRKNRISRDKKRYWRIACSNSKPFLLYIDMVNIVYRYSVVHVLNEDHAVCLAIVPVVVIPPNLR